IDPPFTPSRMKVGYEVAVTGTGDSTHVRGAAGTATSYSFTVGNNGFFVYAYSLPARSKLWWADLSQLPSTISLGPGESRLVTIPVNIPSAAGTTDVEQFLLTASSQGYAGVVADAYGYVGAGGTGNSPPVLSPIADQVIPAGGSLTLS